MEKIGSSRGENTQYKIWNPTIPLESIRQVLVP